MTSIRHYCATALRHYCTTAVMSNYRTITSIRAVTLPRHHLDQLDPAPIDPRTSPFVPGGRGDTPPLPPASPTCISQLRLPPASPTCISQLHLPPASLNCISHLHLLPASPNCISQLHLPPASPNCISQLHLPTASPAPHNPSSTPPITGGGVLHYTTTAL